MISENHTSLPPVRAGVFKERTGHESKEKKAVQYDKTKESG